MKKLNLYCFPHAGGSAAIFKKWENGLTPSIRMIAPELAGRGRRIGDKLYKDHKEAVNDIISNIDLDQPFALLGHSMGAMLAFEVTRKLQLQGLPVPLHLFLVGRGAPSKSPPSGKDYHALSDEAFKQKLKELGGTPEGFFTDPQLFNFFLPLLRSDFTIAENYFFDRPILPLKTRMTVMLGKTEDISSDRINAWKHHAMHPIKIRYFNGGHFFLHDQFMEVCELINGELSK